MNINEINERIQKESQFVEKLLAAAGTVIVGQTYMLERLLLGLLADGHILLEGVPGLAKTTAVNVMSRLIKVSFKRIQFTPDLLPADLIGTMIYDQKNSTFVVKKGPLFANLVLADEINRAPSKVQSALLESMQERQITLGDSTYPLPEPFLVMATQNPIEQEGTYPLPEAQVDRFMLKLVVRYPNKKEEKVIIDRNTGEETPVISPVIGPEDILRARKAVRSIYIDDKVKNYILDIVFATRNPAEAGLKDLQGLVEYGASPRASIYLTAVAKAHAFLRGRGYVTPEDVKAIGMDVLRHRLILTYEAEAEDMTPEMVIQKIFDHIEVP
jgi:MoxR-like ATPase